MAAVIAICFTLSGAAGLLLQVVWVRRFVEVFGSSTLAISTVLATFMAGLALGSFVGGRLADRLRSGAGAPGGAFRHPLCWYAVCEATVGASALAVPAVIAACRPLNAILWRHLFAEPGWLALVRCALSFAILIVPTTAMGATLPLLSRWAAPRREQVGELGNRVGGLFAANTAGAVAGAAAAGFWLIPAIGVAATNRLAAAIELAVAAGAACALAAHARRAATADAPAADAPAADPTSAEAAPGAGAADPTSAAAAVTARARRVAVLAYAGSGAVAMSLEVFYSRALAVTLGSSIYSFTLVLVAFLIGISAGAAVAARAAPRSRDPVGLLSWVVAATALAVAASALAVGRLPAMVLALLAGTPLSADAIWRVDTLLAALVILPCALGFGAVLPLVVRAYAGDHRRVGGDVGRAYAANTVGAIAGALGAGFALLPHIGLENGFLACVCAEAAVALALAGVAPRRRPVAAAVAALALAVAVVTPRWSHSDFTSGLFRTHVLRFYARAGGLRARHVVFYKDGVSTTVSVEHRGGRWILKNNGKVEASNREDMPTQILVGLLPVLLGRAADQHVFVVGYGSGVTVGSIALAPAVERVDVVELEPAIYEAADRYFGSFNHRPQQNRKVHRFVGDGRNFLLASSRRYDVIVSEPSNPWIAGVSSLFSLDFYEFAKRHLARGGLFCQWAQLYELGPRNVKMIYRTFAAAFPYVYAFTPGGTTDTILIGSETPVPLDLARLRRRFGAPAVAAELARAGVHAPEQIAASLLLAPDEIASFSAGADLNTDDRPRLEYAAPRDLLDADRIRQFARAVHGLSWPYGHLDGVVTGLGRPPERARAELAISRDLLANGRRREAGYWLARAARDRDAAAPAQTASPDPLVATRRLLALTAPAEYAEPELPVTAGGAPVAPPGPGAFRGGRAAAARAAAAVSAAYRLLAAGDWNSAWLLLSRLPPRADTPAGRDVTLVMGYTAYKALDLARAETLLAPLARSAYAARRPAALYYYGRVLFGRGRFRDGVAALSRFVRDHPRVAAQAVAARLPDAGPAPH